MTDYPTWYAVSGKDVVMNLDIWTPQTDKYGGVTSGGRYMVSKDFTPRFAFATFSPTKQVYPRSGIIYSSNIRPTFE